MVKQINVGDTVVIRGVVQGRTLGDVLQIDVSPLSDGSLHCVAESRVSEVIPAPRVPKPGEIWRIPKYVHSSDFRVVCKDGDRWVVQPVGSSGYQWAESATWNDTWTFVRDSE